MVLLRVEFPGTKKQLDQHGNSADQHVAEGGSVHCGAVLGPSTVETVDLRALDEMLEYFFAQTRPCPCPVVWNRKLI